MLGHKIRLNKFKRIENILSSFSDDNVINLELSHSKNMGKEHMETRQHIAKSKGVQMRKLKRESEIPQDRKKWNHKLSKICKIKKKASLRGNVIVLQAS